MVTVLRDAIKNLTESTKEREFDEMVGLVSGQKIGLKINILNLLHDWLLLNDELG